MLKALGLTSGNLLASHSVHALRNLSLTHQLTHFCQDSCPACKQISACQIVLTCFTVPAAAAIRVLRPAAAHLHFAALPAAGQDRQVQNFRRHRQPWRVPGGVHR